MTEGYCSCKVKCQICTHEWNASYPASAEKLECPHCENVVDFDIVEDYIKKAKE